MGEECEPSAVTGVSPKVTEIRINKVSNGFIIGGFRANQKIANTLDEALSLAKKELE